MVYQGPGPVFGSGEGNGKGEHAKDGGGSSGQGTEYASAVVTDGADITATTTSRRDKLAMATRSTGQDGKKSLPSAVQRSMVSTGTGTEDVGSGTPSSAGTSGLEGSASGNGAGTAVGSGAAVLGVGKCILRMFGFFGLGVVVGLWS